MIEAAIDHVFSVTLTGAVAAAAPDAAVTWADPSDTPVTKPPVTVAIKGASVDQVALLVTSPVLPSE
jgi:hypothetical protein